MKFICVILIITLCSMCSAGTINGLFIDHAHPGKCSYEGLILSPGEQGQPEGKCENLLCSQEDGSGIIQTCGTQIAKTPCKLGEYVTPDGPYPKCCEREVICPEISE